MARALSRLGLFAARRRWVVLGAWVVVVAGLVALSHLAGSNTSDNLNLPGTDSQAASNLLAAQFPPRQNGNSPLVFRTPAGTKVTDSRNKRAIEASYKQVRKLPHVASAVVLERDLAGMGGVAGNSGVHHGRESRGDLVGPLLVLQPGDSASNGKSRW